MLATGCLSGNLLSILRVQNSRFPGRSDGVGTTYNSRHLDRQCDTYRRIRHMSSHRQADRSATALAQSQEYRSSAPYGSRQ